MEDLAKILHELRLENIKAKRAPTHLKAKHHRTLNDLLDKWELATAVTHDIDGLGQE